MSEATLNICSLIIDEDGATLKLPNSGLLICASSCDIVQRFESVPGLVLAELKFGGKFMDVVLPTLISVGYFDGDSFCDVRLNVEEVGEVSGMQYIKVLAIIDPLTDSKELQEVNEAFVGHSYDGMPLVIIFYAYTALNSINAGIGTKVRHSDLDFEIIDYNHEGRYIAIYAGGIDIPKTI